MTNIDRAANAIAQCWPNGRPIRTDDAAVLAQKMHDAGLLAPDDHAEKETNE